MKNKVYYVQTTNGVGLRAARSLAVAHKEVCKEVGEYNIKGISLATEENIKWIKDSFGYVPDEVK